MRILKSRWSKIVVIYEYKGNYNKIVLKLLNIAVVCINVHILFTTPVQLISVWVELRDYLVL